MLVRQTTQSPAGSDTWTGLVRQTTESFEPSKELNVELEGAEDNTETVKPRLRKTNPITQVTAETIDIVTGPPVSENRNATKTSADNSNVTEYREHHATKTVDSSQVTGPFDQRAARQRLTIPLITHTAKPAPKLSTSSEPFEVRKLSFETDDSDLRKLSVETTSSDIRQISAATDSELMRISFPTDSSELRKLSEATDSELRKLSLVTDSSEASEAPGGRIRLLTAGSETTFSLVSPLVDEPDDDTVSRRDTSSTENKRCNGVGFKCLD